MKRRLLIIAIFLLAGAVVNVAVAWGCAAWAPSTALAYSYSPHVLRSVDPAVLQLANESYGWPV
ncbi:MAG: hypothetical protein ACYSVY_18375, partial [Planctomycetota bacterium]